MEGAVVIWNYPLSCSVSTGFVGYICMYICVRAFMCVCIGGWMYTVTLGTRLCTGLILVCCLFPPHHKMATAAAKS